MKTITIHIPVVGVGVLTTDHPASSYNRPVFVRAEDGQVFGPGDMVEGQTVESWITASSQYTGAATQPWDSATLNQLERYGVRPINNPVGSTDPNEMKEFFQ